MKRLFVLMISAVALISCARSDIQIIEGKGQLGLTIAERPFEAIDEATRAAESLYDTPDSRAIENGQGVTVFQNGDAIGVYIHTTEAMASAGNHSTNMRYSTSDNGATWRAGNAMGGDLIKGTVYRTTGYYPYQSPVVDPTKVAHSVATDQSATTSTTQTAATAMELSDFMVAYPFNISGVPDSPSSTLTFSHAMCKLLIRVGVPTMIDGATVSGARSIAIKNTKVSSTVNLAAATALVGPTVSAVGQVEDVTPRLMRGTGAAGAVSDYEAVLVPQSIVGETVLVDMVCATNGGGDKSLKYVVEAGKTFDLVQGKKITLSLSSSADLAFMSELDLLDGLAHTDLPLTIKVPRDKDWTLKSDQSWLTLSTTAAGAYSDKITGKSTGADQIVYVKVAANGSSIKAREAILTLATSTSSIIYGALQNYYKFDLGATVVGISGDGQAVPLPETVTNQLWSMSSATALPSWLKIVKGTPSSPPVWSGSTSVTLPYEVVGSLNSPMSEATLYVVAEVSALTASREFKVKFGDREVTIVQGYFNTPSSSDYVLINGLRWAKGNLVASGANGAKVGDKFDGGLYFQFGGLIGWKGGNKASGGTGVGIPDFAPTDNIVWWNGATSFSWADDAMVWPTVMTTKPNAWPVSNGVSAGDRNTVVNQYYFNYNVALYSTEGQNIHEFEGPFSGDAGKGDLGTGRYAVWGIGDPCPYYLGGKWRQATNAEYGALFNNAPNNTAHGSGSKSYISSGYTNVNSSDTGRGIYANATSASSAPTDPNALFFPASGYRTSSNGPFYNVGRYGYSWMASVYNATYSFFLTFNTTRVNSQDGGSRSNGFPVRCVEGISLTASSVAVGAEASSVTLNIIGTGGASWTITETDDTGNGFAPSKTSGTGDGAVTLNISANATKAARTATYTLSSGGFSSAVTIKQSYVNPPAATDYVIINGLKWAKGSLIAVGSDGAKVGASTDAGLTFQFGSLVGWNPTTTPDVAIAVKPAGYTGGTTWTTVGYCKETVTSGTIPATDAPATGIGDACRYYLGDKWRMPILAEYKALFNNATNNTPWATAGGSWQASPAGGKINGLFFLAAGYRSYSDGSLNDVGNGYYWSTSVLNATSGYRLYFSSSYVSPEGNANRTYGFPVRCVEGISFSASSEGVSGDAQTVTLTIENAKGETWSIAETGDATNGFTPNKTSGTGDGTVTVNISANATRALRSATYTLTSASGLKGVITITQSYVNPPDAADYIVINGLKWAKGNLIADGANAAKVGAKTDGGIYFQFGSLIGYKGGNAASGGTGVGIPDFAPIDNVAWWNGATSFSWANDAMVWPTAMTTKPSAWLNNYGSAVGDRNTVVNQYFFNYNVNPYSTGGQNIREFNAPFAGDAASGNLGSARYAVWGIGDPCSYYLGGKWRQATNLEFAALFNNVANGTAYGTSAKSYPSSSYTNDANSSATGRGIYANATSAASAPTDPNALFFPASGYRYYSNGSFYLVGRYGYSWSGSVYTATYGFSLYFYTSSVYPQSSYTRSYGFPVRCVEGVSLTASSLAVTTDAQSVTLNVNGTDGAAWTIAEAGDTQGAFTPSRTSGSGDATISVSISANPNKQGRSAIYTLTAGSAKASLTIGQESATAPKPNDYLVIDGLKWAKGNLVASGTHGAKIGSGSDGGLYFQFGSLIGWKGGNKAFGGTGAGIPDFVTADGVWWNGATAFSWENDAMVWPTEMTTNPTAFPSRSGGNISTLSDYFFNYSMPPYAAAFQDIRDFDVSIAGAGTTGNLASGRYAALGVGDPCSYYLGGKWRTPTAAEYKTLFNNVPNDGTWATAGGTWIYSPASASIRGLLFPASGCRHYVTGSFYYLRSSGYCWSSSVNGIVYGGYSMHVFALNLAPQASNGRSNGFPVRCVSE